MGAPRLPAGEGVLLRDDTLTDNVPRVMELARAIGKLGIVWSLQRQGQCAARGARGDEGQRATSPAGRL